MAVSLSVWCDMLKLFDSIGSAVKVGMHDPEGIKISPQHHLQLNPAVSPVAEAFTVVRKRQCPRGLVGQFPSSL